MIGKRIEDALVTELRPIELLAVFVQQAEIDERSHVRRKGGRCSLIKLQRRVVVAAAIGLDRQAEERAGVLAVNLDGPFKQSNDLGRTSAQRCHRGPALIEVFGGLLDSSRQLIEDLQRLFWIFLVSIGLGRGQPAVVAVVARCFGRGV